MVSHAESELSESMGRTRFLCHLQFFVQVTQTGLPTQCTSLLGPKSLLRKMAQNWRVLITHAVYVLHKPIGRTYQPLQGAFRKDSHHNRSQDNQIGHSRRQHNHQRQQWPELNMHTSLFFFSYLPKYLFLSSFILWTKCPCFQFLIYLNIYFSALYLTNKTDEWSELTIFSPPLGCQRRKRK